MNSIIRNSIQPTDTPNSFKYNDAPLSPAQEGGETSSDKSTQFRDMISRSSADAKEEQVNKKNRKISDAKSDQEFFQMLNDQTETQRVPKNTLDKDDFLKLFVTQLQKQDPLQPQDSSQMAAQLAQFNSLEQMLNVNKTLTDMLKAQNHASNLSLVQYIGKEVSIEKGQFSFKDGKVSDSVFELPKDSSSVTLKVYDELGNKISDKQLQGLKAGEHKFSWDGMNTNGEKQPSGQYHFQVEALTTDSQTMPVKVTTKIKINGVDIKDPEGAFFTEVGKIKAADLMSVNELKQAFLPEVKPTESKPQEVKPVPEKKLSSKNENPEKTQKLSQG